MNILMNKSYGGFKTTLLIIAIFLRPKAEFETKPLTQRQVVERNSLYPWTHNFEICEHIFMCKIL
jgi:hypothetical protein